jgi:hypothetical protein
MHIVAVLVISSFFAACGTPFGLGWALGAALVTGTLAWLALRPPPAQRRGPAGRRAGWNDRFDDRLEIMNDIADLADLAD